MKKILLLSIIMLLLLITGARKIEESAESVQEEANLWDQLKFAVAGIGFGLSYSCFYHAEEDSWYLFLPSAVQDSELLLQSIPCDYITIDGETYRAGDQLMQLWEKDNCVIVFYDQQNRQMEDGRIKVMKSENLPSLHINTASGDMQYIYESKGHAETANMQVLTESGELAAAVRLDAIKGRGNTSWEPPKKPFEIRLDQPLDLLGLDKSKSFVLIANYYDITGIRNWIGFELEKTLEAENTTASRFVDLYLNGQYAGFYQVAEKVENSRNNVQGGYLLEFEHYPRLAEKPHILLANNQPILVRGENTVNEEELDQVSLFLAEMEQALNADDYINPHTKKHIFEYIDKTSFAKRYVMEEFFQDMDAGYTSQYMYLSPAGDSFVLYAGPVWDLDNTMGRGIVTEASQLFADRFDLSMNNLSRWHARLYANEEFYQEVSEQYRTYAEPFLIWLLSEGIEEWQAKTDAAVMMDHIRFGTDRSAFVMEDNSVKGNWNYLIDYLTTKMLFLNSRWGDNPEAVKLWREERLTELPPLEERPIPEESLTASDEAAITEATDAESADSDGSQDTADSQDTAGGIGQAVTWLLLYKRYWLLGCIMLGLLLMIGMEHFQQSNSSPRRQT